MLSSRSLAFGAFFFGILTFASASGATLPPLGPGVNFANRLESPHPNLTSPRRLSELFDAIRSAGFRAVRVPIRWSNHAQSRPPYEIEPAFFAQVDEIVYAGVERGLTVVIDMHHYNQLTNETLDDGEFSVPTTVVEDRFVAMWRQIALRYADEPRTVIFELYNEPARGLSARRWNGLFARALAEVRRTNPTRFIVVGPIGWNSPYELKNLRLPAGDRNLIATFHSYAPFAFTHQGAPWVGMTNAPEMRCCDARRKAEIAAPIAAAAAWAKRAHRPLWLGEFGSYERAPRGSRAEYTRAARSEAEKRSIPWAYWELDSTFGIYDPQARAWRASLLAALMDRSKR